MDNILLSHFNKLLNEIYQVTTIKGLLAIGQFGYMGYPDFGLFVHTDKIKDYLAIIESVHDADVEIKETFSVTAITRKVADLIHEKIASEDMSCRFEGKEMFFNDQEIRTFFADLKKTSKIKLPLVTPIYGVSLIKDDPVRFGKFTVFEFPKHQAKLPDITRCMDSYHVGNE